MMYTALKADHPTVIRYPRGIGEGVEWEDTPFELLNEGRGECIAEGRDIAIIAIGTTAAMALRAAERSTKSVAVYDIRYVKPLDKELILDVARHYKSIITIEDGILRGGVGEAITATIAKAGLCPTIKCLGIDDCFVEQGKPEELYAECGYNEEAILACIEAL
jgi:1-deoxy-D-xylulose-5-phosphate synthase